MIKGLYSLSLVLLGCDYIFVLKFKQKCPLRQTRETAYQNLHSLASLSLEDWMRRCCAFMAAIFPFLPLSTRKSLRFCSSMPSIIFCSLGCCLQRRNTFQRLFQICALMRQICSFISWRVGSQGTCWQSLLGRSSSSPRQLSDTIPQLCLSFSIFLKRKLTSASCSSNFLRPAFCILLLFCAQPCEPRSVLTSVWMRSLALLLLQLRCVMVLLSSNSFLVTGESLTRIFVFILGSWVLERTAVEAVLRLLTSDIINNIIANNQRQVSYSSISQDLDICQSLLLLRARPLMRSTGRTLCSMDLKDLPLSGMWFSLRWDYLRMQILSGRRSLAVVLLGDYAGELHARVPLGLNKWKEGQSCSSLCFLRLWCCLGGCLGELSMYRLVVLTLECLFLLDLALRLVASVLLLQQVRDLVDCTDLTDRLSLSAALPSVRCEYFSSILLPFDSFLLFSRSMLRPEPSSMLTPCTSITCLPAISCLIQMEVNLGVAVGWLGGGWASKEKENFSPLYCIIIVNLPLKFIINSRQTVVVRLETQLEVLLRAQLLHFVESVHASHPLGAFA